MARLVNVPVALATTTHVCPFTCIQLLSAYLSKWGTTSVARFPFQTWRSCLGLHPDEAHPHTYRDRVEVHEHGHSCLYAFKALLWVWCTHPLTTLMVCGKHCGCRVHRLSHVGSKEIRPCAHCQLALLVLKMIGWAWVVQRMPKHWQHGQGAERKRMCGTPTELAKARRGALGEGRERARRLPSMLKESLWLH